VTARVSTPEFPTASFAVTVIVFNPAIRVMPVVQDVVPVQVPLPPALEDHVTVVTPILSDAVPEMLRGVVVVV